MLEISRLPERAKFERVGARELDDTELEKTPELSQSTLMQTGWPSGDLVAVYLYITGNYLGFDPLAISPCLSFIERLPQGFGLQ